MMSRTRYISVDALQPETDLIEIAAEIIRSGELVAFPTETVYGLGADAFQPRAVEKIFQAKRRPPENALLVHVSNMTQVERLTTEIPSSALSLMEHFWPGPLSIILPSHTSVPEIVRGGQKGVGLRMPSHPVALALIESTGPLAAPSANLFGRPSPTNAKHVQQDLDDKIAAVLDAGETGSGMESTLIDLSGNGYRVLRLGAISIEEIENCLEQKLEVVKTKTLPRYKTKVQVILSDGETDFKFKLKAFRLQRLVLGVVHIGDTQGHKIENVSRVYDLDPSGMGMTRYSILRDAEENGLEALLFGPVDPEQARVAPALMDRLRRSASKNDF